MLSNDTTTSRQRENSMLLQLFWILAPSCCLFQSCVVAYTKCYWAEKHQTQNLLDSELLLKKVKIQLHLGSWKCHFQRPYFKSDFFWWFCYTFPAYCLKTLTAMKNCYCDGNKAQFIFQILLTCLTLSQNTSNIKFSIKKLYIYSGTGYIFKTKCSYFQN